MSKLWHATWFQLLLVWLGFAALVYTAGAIFATGLVLPYTPSYPAAEILAD